MLCREILAVIFQRIENRLTAYLPCKLFDQHLGVALRPVLYEVFLLLRVGHNSSINRFKYHSAFSKSVLPPLFSYLHRYLMTLPLRYP